jgi:thiol-disulfide isomerase/thioredoxin
MKTKSLIFGALALAGSAFAQNRSISFDSSSWKTLLDKAKKENKLVYLDAYTSWCGPCKWMAKNIFTNDTVADFYNSHFINAKIDMEKGEGVDIAQTYGVRAYPTMLFIDGEGNIVHRTCGSAYAADFVKIGEDALDPAKQVAGFTKKFNAGNRDAAFVNHYFGLLEQGCQSFDKEFETYISSQDEASLSSAANWKIIYNYADLPTSKAFKYLEAHKDEFSKNHTADSVEEKINRVYRNRFARVKEKSELETLKTNLRKTATKEADKIAMMADVNFYANTADWKKYAQSSVAYMDKYPDLEAGDVNSISWKFYEHVEDKASLAKAAEWMKKVTLDFPTYAFEDTYAAVLYKLGKKNEAKQAAEKAIESAKKSGEDYQETEELLKKINKLK